MRGFTAYLPRAEFHNQVTSAAQGVGWKLWANVDSSRCFLKLNDIFKWQLFLPPPPSPASAFQYFVGNTSWGVGGGGGLFTTDESGKYHYLLKTADLMVTTLSLVFCIICLYSICWLKRSLCIAHANFCKEQKIYQRLGVTSSTTQMSI